MNREQVKSILRYFYDIPTQIGLLQWEKTKYQKSNRALVPPASAQLDRVQVKICVLNADAALVQTALDCLQARYQKLLTLRYAKHYTWSVLATQLSVSTKTVQRWYRKALERLGQILDDTPMVDELLLRAACAQD